MKALEGVVMELDDCAFPLLAGVEATSDLATAFDGASSWALLVGSVPAQGRHGALRPAQRQRGDLQAPGPRHRARTPRRDVRVLVVGNPCNTNCLIARSDRPGGPGRPLVRDDPPRPEPRRDPAGQARRRAGRRRSRTSPSGATTPRPSSPTSPTRPSAAGRPPRPSATTSGCAASSSRPSRSVARRSSRPAGPARRRRRPTRRSTPSSGCHARPRPTTACRWRSPAPASTGRPRA